MTTIEEAVKMSEFEAMHLLILEALDCGFDEAIYCGSKELDIIRRAAYGPESTGLAEIRDHRLWFAGLPVYVVDSRNHWRVA